MECPACKAIVYCSKACKNKDDGVHSAVCEMLRTEGDLNDVEVKRNEVAAAIKAFNKQLGKECAEQMFSSPVPHTSSGAAAATSGASESRQAGLEQSSKWEHVFRAAEPSNSATSDVHAAAILKRFADAMSYPLSVVAASSIFPLARRALTRRQDEDVHVHVLGASETAECSFVSAWRSAVKCFHLLGTGPSSLFVSFVGLDVPERLHNTEKSLGGESKARFFRGTYDAFRAEHSTTPPALVLGYNMGLSCPDYNWTPTLRVLARLGCPIVVTTNTFMELSMEQEILESKARMACEGVSENPFPCPCPAQSGTVANDVYRRNQWFGIFFAAQRTSHVDNGDTSAGEKPKKKRRKT